MTIIVITITIIIVILLVSLDCGAHRGAHLGGVLDMGALLLSGCNPLLTAEYMYIYIYIYMYLSMYTYIYIYIYLYIHTSTCLSIYISVYLEVLHKEWMFRHRGWRVAGRKHPQSDPVTAGAVVDVVL